MRVIDPGHTYELDCIDTIDKVRLVFVKRDNPPEMYPGNVGNYPGVQMQEVMRALVDRLEYLADQALTLNDKQSVINDEMIANKLRECILVLEQRNARKKGRQLSRNSIDIEKVPTCPTCGHIDCEGNHYGRA